MGKSSNVGVAKGLRGLIRSMSYKAKPSAPDIQEEIQPIVKPEEPNEEKGPSPAAGIDEDAKLPDQKPTEKFKLPDQELTEQELKDTIEALETMLRTMHRMALVAPLLSEASVEFSKAMKVYAKSFESRYQGPPIPGSAGGPDDHRKNARHGCFSHASVFWEQISGMQSFIAETVRRDYKLLNRQVQSYFDLHSSEEKSSETLITEYARMLSRVGEVDPDRLPEFRTLLEDPHEPGGWTDARSREEAASHHKKLSLQDGACPVSGFTRDQNPPDVDPPAIYPGPLRVRRGLGPPPFKLNNPHHQVLFDELLEKLQRPSSELNSALREIESAFLSRVAVGLTSKGFQSLRGAFRNTDEWKGIEGLKYYANELNIDFNSARSDISSIPSPPRKVEGSEDLHINAQKHKDLAWKRRSSDAKANFPHDMSAPVLSHSTRRMRRYSAEVGNQNPHTGDDQESSSSSSPKSAPPCSSSPHSTNDSPRPHGGNHGPGSAPTGNNQGQPPSTPKGQGTKGNNDHNISSSFNEHHGQHGNSGKDGKGQRSSNLPEERVDTDISGAQSGEQEIPLPKSPVCSGPDSNGSGNGKQSLSTPPTSSGSLPVQPPDRPKKLQVMKLGGARVSFALQPIELDAKSGDSMEGAFGSNGNSGDQNSRRLGWKHSLHSIKEQFDEGSPRPTPPLRVDERSVSRNTAEAVDKEGKAAATVINRLPADRVHHIRRSGGFEILPGGQFIQYGPLGDHYVPPKPPNPIPEIHMPSNTPRSTKELEKLARRYKSRFIASTWDDGFPGYFDYQ